MGTIIIKMVIYLVIVGQTICLILTIRIKAITCSKTINSNQILTVIIYILEFYNPNYFLKRPGQT